MSRSNIAKFDTTTKVWTGPMGKYPYSLDTHATEIIIEALDKNPEKIVQINHEKGTTWKAKQLKLAAIRVAQNLIKLEIQPDDIISFVTKDSERVLPLILGVLFAGAVTNMISISLSEDEIKQVFAQTEPKVVICDSDAYENTSSALEELKKTATFYTVIERVPGVAFVNELCSPTGYEDKFVPLKFEQTADKKLMSIVCTSGTTNKPKGVNMSAVQLFSSILLRVQPSPPYRTLNFNPLFYGSRPLGIFSSILNQSETRISMQSSFSIETITELVEKHRPTVLVLLPMDVAALLKSSDSCDFSSIRTVVTYGEIIPEKLREVFKETFPGVFLSTTYVMAETLCTYSFPVDSFDGLTVGKIANNIYLKICNAEDENLGYKESGEIRIKPEFCFNGYYNNPEATANALDAEGYFKTGDIGCFDENANLFIMGRKNEVFQHKKTEVRFLAAADNV